MIGCLSSELRRITTISFAAVLLVLLFWIIVPRAGASEASSPRPESGPTQPDQQPEKPGVSATSSPTECQSGEVRAHHKITVAGCLAGEDGKFAFSTYSGEHYELLGDSALVNKHGGWPPGNNVCIRGTLSSDASAINVISVSDLPQPVAGLNTSIGRPSQWSQHTNRAYGLSFPLPKTFSTTNDDQYIEPNFPVENGVITLGKFTIPEETFGSRDELGCSQRSNFFGGSLALFVNPQIQNSAACGQFGQSDPKDRSLHTYHSVKYSETTGGSGGMGKWYSYYFYHTFQNGLCYEFVFSSLETAVNPDADCGCAIPIMSGYDTFMDQILSQFDFSKPQTVIAVSSNSATTPIVTSFTTSSPVADQSKNRGEINFSWSTQNADYVRLSYHCTGGEVAAAEEKNLLNLGLDGIIIAERGGPSKGCGGKLDPITLINHSSNSSQIVGFANFDYITPAEVRVTVTPFSHGIAYATAAKTIPISIYPRNPFPDGLPAPTGSITFLSPVDTKGVSSYRQASSSRIEWTDSETGDDHFWIHLARDGSGGVNYLYQIAGYVPRTDDRTHYTWVVPRSYSGSGFRIFINSQHRDGNKFEWSYALSPPFNITP